MSRATELGLPATHLHVSLGHDFNGTHATQADLSLSATSPLTARRCSMPVSTTHLLLLPTYNTGPRLAAVVAEALRHWQPVLVVVDGSTDGSERPVEELARREPALSVLKLATNSGKGAAVLAGAALARERGLTHMLTMDADGQHPAASIDEFMSASQARPDAMILGRPVFPANIPLERLYARQLTIGLVHMELLGRNVADPLFGFRVYPVAPLLAVLGPRSGGRRYDFDTEAVVRLAWSGVPPLNLSAPVRYFSAAEGGVSHFHYLRDNATLVAMHARLLIELLFCRWPALLRHRRAWRTAALAVALFLGASVTMPAAETDDFAVPAHRLAAGAPEWQDLVAAFGRNPDVTADFTERRFFPFRKGATELAGEVRVSAQHGLSLHYTKPETRTVILDDGGVLIRAPEGEKAPPADPRAASANEALMHLLRFNFAALGEDFDLYGERQGNEWKLLLVARTEALQRSVGRITARGEGPTIRQIEIRRTARQAIEIAIAPPKATAAFTADELKRFFR